MRAFLALNAAEQRQAFGGDFRIGQNIFDGSEFCLGKEEGVRFPIQESFVKQLLRANARTQDPERSRNFSGDCGDEKGLGRFGDVRKSDRAYAFRDLADFLRDRFSVRSDGGKLIARRFFHRACFAGTRRRSNLRNRPPTRDRARISFDHEQEHEHDYDYIFRPTASATARKRGTRSAKTSGRMACSPSLLANCGESWTSIMTASAPAATAASAICGTKSRRPMPWVGSTTTGKCVFDFRIGTALRSRV